MFSNEDYRGFQGAQGAVGPQGFQYTITSNSKQENRSSLRRVIEEDKHTYTARQNLQWYYRHIFMDNVCLCRAWDERAESSIFRCVHSIIEDSDCTTPLKLDDMYYLTAKRIGNFV